MGIIVQKCLYDYDCSKCRGEQTNCVAYAQKKWHDVSAINQKHLSELEGYRDKITSRELISVVHGHWIGRGSEQYCSECSTDFDIYAYNVDSFSYCPSCGAKMDIK